MLGGWSENAGMHIARQGKSIVKVRTSTILYHKNQAARYVHGAAWLARMAYRLRQQLFDCLSLCQYVLNAFFSRSTE